MEGSLTVLVVNTIRKFRDELAEKGNWLKK
jgi:hypothetical protein